MDSQETSHRPPDPRLAESAPRCPKSSWWPLISLVAIGGAVLCGLFYSTLAVLEHRSAEAGSVDQPGWGPLGVLVAMLAAASLLTGLLAGYLIARRKGAPRGNRPRDARDKGGLSDRSLHDSDSRFRSLVETSSDWIWETDANGVYTYVSPRVKDLLGYEPEEVLGKAAFDFMPPDEAKRVAATFLILRKSGKQIVALENTNLHKDGRLVVLETSAMPLLDDNGNLRGYRGVDRDVTERKRAENNVKQKRRRLRQLLDLQEQERKLVAYEIHDGLAQQLTGALLKLQTFGQVQDHNPEEGQAACDEVKRLLRDSIDEARRLISGLRPPILDESGVVAAIEYLICEGQQQAEQEIEFSHQVHFDRLAPPLETAAFRIVQESLTNACRHSQSKRVRVELTQQDDRLHIRVEDWGVGFDPTTVEENRFGLQGIRERARLLEGRAVVDSAPGQGTRITVELPLLEGVPADATSQVAQSTE